jgi:hypothetical protein
MPATPTCYGSASTGALANSRRGIDYGSSRLTVTAAAAIGCPLRRFSGKIGARNVP